MSAGGKRKGAGRKPLDPADKPEAITIKAHPSAVRAFRIWAFANGLSHRQAFERIARRLR